MMSEIGEMIRSMRKASGMSQMKLADQIDVSYQQVQKYEKGSSNISITRLMQIAKVFDVPVTAFLGKGMGDGIREQAAFSNLSEDEGKLLMLFRRLKRKQLKRSFLEILKDIVDLNEGE